MSVRRIADAQTSFQIFLADRGLRPTLKSHMWSCSRCRKAAGRGAKNVALACVPDGIKGPASALNPMGSGKHCARCGHFPRGARPLLPQTSAREADVPYPMETPRPKASPQQPRLHTSAAQTYALHLACKLHPSRYEDMHMRTMIPTLGYRLACSPCTCIGLGRAVHACTSESTDPAWQLAFAVAPHGFLAPPPFHSAC